MSGARPAPATAMRRRSEMRNAMVLCTNRVHCVVHGSPRGNLRVAGHAWFACNTVQCLHGADADPALAVPAADDRVSHRQTARSCTPRPAAGPSPREVCDVPAGHPGGIGAAGSPAKIRAAARRCRARAENRAGRASPRRTGTGVFPTNSAKKIPVRRGFRPRSRAPAHLESPRACDARRLETADWGEIRAGRRKKRTESRRRTAPGGT